MRWPWSKTEKRDSGGDFSDAVVRLIESQAAGTAADASSTAAVEAASGTLSRAFASADVQGEGWARDLVSPSLPGAGRPGFNPQRRFHARNSGCRVPTA